MRPVQGDVVAALERLPLPVFTVSLNGTVSWLNESAQDLLGGSVGDHYTTFVAPESQRGAEERLARRRHGDTSAHENEVVLLRRDGSRVVVEMNTVPLEDGGHINAVFGVFVPERELPPVALHAPELTPRQIEVLRYLAAGASTRQMADTMGISHETVRNHVREVLKRLGAHSRLGAVVAARERGII
jgi:PAS domain S-box-containing protein